MTRTEDVVADLHVHTTNSDGTLTLETLPSAARRHGVDTVAVTDHDRLHPGLDKPVTNLDGVRVVHGIELRVAAESGRVDLLGYGVRPTDRLRELVDHLQADRIERGRRIIECVETETGVDLDITVEEGIGRPHIARAIEASDAPYDYEDAFTDLIGSDCPCYVSRDIPDFETGRDILDGACGVVGLAHPFRYSDPEQALGLVEHLDAVEWHYPYDHAIDEHVLEQTVEDYEVLVTGGTDAHGTDLGLAGLDIDEWHSLREHL
jgi:predicted metal-dependent phosphoesterase TrpH